MPDEPKAYKYFAFISYSRKDSKVAAWLQKRLEWFRFPVKLVPEDRRPPNPKYVRPVYRDKTNLEVTDEHYWTNIRRALEDSRFLIVLCSPNSAKSEPVNMEVKHFLEKHDHLGSHIVPVILSGSVTSSGDDASFCPILRELGDSLISRNLPSMVPDTGGSDLDAWELGFIAIISYLLKLDRDAVGSHIQSETRKQARVLRRWLFAVTILTLLSLLLGGLAWKNEMKAKANELVAKNEATRADENAKKADRKAQEANENARIAKANEERAEAEKKKAKEEEVRANYNAKVADEEKSKAVLLNIEASNSSLVRSREAFANDDNARGFAYLSEALRLHPKNQKAKRDAVLNMLLRPAPVPLAMVPPLQHAESVLDAKFSHDGSKVITASEDGTAQVWDVDTGKPIGTRLKHKQKVTWVEFSPNDKLVVTASWDQTAQIWDSNSGNPVGPSLQHNDIVPKACFSPNGQIVATASRDKTIKLWDVSLGMQVGSDLLIDDHPCSLSFSADGNLLAVGTQTVGSVFVWEVGSTKRVNTSLDCRYGPALVSYSPDGKKLAITSGDGTLQVLSTQSTQLPSKPFFSFDRAALLEPAWSPNGDIISLTWGSDLEGFRVTFLDVTKKGGEEILSDQSKVKITKSPCFSPDGLRAVIPLADGSTRTYTLSRQIVNRLDCQRHSNRIWSVAFTPDGTKIVTASADGTACIWSSAKEAPKTIELRHKSVLCGIDWHPSSNYVLTVEQNGYVWFWPQTASAEPSRLLGDPPLRRGYFSPDGRHALYTSITKNEIWIVPDQFPNSTPSKTHLGRGFSPDSLYAVHPSENNRASVRDTSSNRTIIQGPNHAGMVTDACFSYDGRYAMSAAETGDIKIWDPRTGEQLGETISHGSPVFSCSFSPDNRFCVTLGTERDAKVWDVASQKLRHTFEKGPFQYRRANFSYDSSRIFISGGNTAQICSTDKFEPLGAQLVHELEIFSGCFSPSDRDASLK